MFKTPFTNNGTTAVYAGGVLVRPGETRMVDPNTVDGLATTAAPEAPAPSGQTHNLLSLLDQSIPKVVEAIRELSDADLEAVRVAEEGGKTRKGVLEAIEALRIERVAAAEAQARDDAETAAKAQAEGAGA